MTYSTKVKPALQKKRVTKSRASRVLLAAIPAILMGKPVTAQPSFIDSENESPFFITVDGQAVDENGDLVTSTFGVDPRNSLNDQSRKTDIDLSAVDIQIKADGLELNPILNISTSTGKHSYQGSETVSFLPTSNYPAFIEHAELRIREVGTTDIEIIPVTVNTEANWTMPDEGSGRYSYVLRVYDRAGRFDETEPLSLSRTRRFFQSAGAAASVVAAGMGEDRTATRNIPVNGSAVTVFGRNVPPGYEIQAFGEQIPVDPNQSFVAQRILAPGDQTVDVVVNGPAKGGELRFRRNIDIPENQWFYVALMDLTVGQNTGDNNIESVRDGEFDEVYTDGRAAFYLKGRIRGRYLLTAAADLDDDGLEDLFGARDLKDPRSILARIDPDEFYPVYGDDSFIVDDAPTDGRLFVRIESGESHAMWGTYKTEPTQSEFVRSDRELYGASVVYRSETVIGSGELQTEASAYAAQPGTLPQRDEFLATGGSSYFLRRQDILIGSETVIIETRDSVTGRVTSRNVLSSGADYSFNHLQGLLILNRPVSSTTTASGPVRNSALGGDEVFVVVQYEFVPLSTDPDTYSYGGRVQHWVNDNVRVGVSQMSEQVGDSELNVAAVDVRIQKSEGTYLEAEIGRSEGALFGSSISTNGGLSVSDEEVVAFDDGPSEALRVEGSIDLADLGQKGTIGGYYEEKTAGFSTLTEQTPVDEELFGVHANVPVAEEVDLQVSHDQLNDSEGTRKQETDVALVWARDDKLKVTLGVSRTELRYPSAVVTAQTGRNGERIDVGARVDYSRSEDQSFYAFGQTERESSGDIASNDRIGVGTEFRLSDKVTASAELSTGETGLGALAALSYSPTAGDRYYVGYRLDPDRQFDQTGTNIIGGDDRGVIVAGARRQLNQAFAVYAEQNYDLFGRRQSLTQTYGIEYTPNTRWTFDGGFQIGDVTDTNTDPETGLEQSDFERRALSFGVGYSNDATGVRGNLRAEFISDRSEDRSRDGDSYFLNARFGFAASEDWRVLLGTQAVVSEAFGDSFESGEFLDSSIGFAYRPVENDRLNALFRYRYVYDDHQADQIDAEDLLQQESHILSVDANYSVNPRLTVGAKYGFRFGEASFEGDGILQDTEAHLGILRADYHITDNWDVLMEGRVLNNISAETTDYGVLASVHRHVGENVKIGVGHNFGSFSDDLADQTLDDRGFFINLVAKF